MRRRRIEQTVELRKARKDNQLLKRRNISLNEESTSTQEDNDSLSPKKMSAEDILYGKLK